MSMPIAFVMKSFWWNFRGSKQLGMDQRRVEPYVLAICADGDGEIHRSVTPIYANSPRQGRQEMTGVGHIFYGPKDPKGVLAFALAVIESDADIRGSGARLDEALADPVVTDASKSVSDLIVRAVATAGNTTPVGAIVDGALSVLHGTIRIVARAMQSNPDDVMWVQSGSLLGATSQPYFWGRRSTIHSTLKGKGKGQSLFGLDYEVLRTDDDLKKSVHKEADANLRKLPSVFTP